MSLLSEIFSHFTRKNSKFKDVKSNYIFYKIVDLNDGVFALQCINTSALFYAKITDIIYDTDILYRLHPIQSCFIGIEYANYIKSHNPDLNISNKKMEPYSLSRYGCYNLSYQNRNGDLIFINNNTNEQFIMDPRDIALCEELITEFDATQAFYIGLSAGLKINNPAKQRNAPNKIMRHLYLIK